MRTAAILAGGRSRRLGGRNKATLSINGASVLERQLAQLGRVADRTIIIANDASPYGSYGVPVIPDMLPGHSALGGLYTAVSSAPGDHTLVVACDMPFLSDALLAFLIDAGRKADIVIPRTARGYEPLCATYTRRTAGALKRLVDEERYTLSEVARIRGLAIREVGEDELQQFGPVDVLFFNVNTPDDYARAIDIDAEYTKCGFR
jgi:molybdopterin-guanine dinucleotide biosynthesis protein A